MSAPGPQQPDEVERVRAELRAAGRPVLADLLPAAPSAQPDETVAVAGPAAHGPWCNGYLIGSCDCATRSPAQPVRDPYDRSKPLCWYDEPGCDCGGYALAQPVRDIEEGRRLCAGGVTPDYCCGLPGACGDC